MTAARAVAAFRPGRGLGGGRMGGLACVVVDLRWLGIGAALVRACVS
ncbi:MAG: hypothetical protein WKF95_14275 [Rubrobacter sp.]